MSSRPKLSDDQLVRCVVFSDIAHRFILEEQGRNNLAVPQSGKFIDIYSQTWEQWGRRYMNVIGANVLSEYGAKHPKALPTLQALYALISQANWAERADVEHDFGELARFREDGRLEIVLSETGCCVTLRIHCGLSVVRILAAMGL